MGEYKDSFSWQYFIEKYRRRNTDVSLIDAPAKKISSTTKTYSFSAQTKESKLLQSLENQISSLKNEITFLWEELNEQDYVVRTLHCTKNEVFH